MSLKLIFDYISLYRKDAALIAFVSYIGGAELAGAADLHDFIAAIAVTIFSVNFIYSFNSWSDIDIDSISKPFRPLPSGRLKPDHVFIYCTILFVISVVYPFFLFSSILPVFLCLLLPMLGLLYSSKPLQIRNRPYISLLIICTGLIIPLLTGFFSKSMDSSYLMLFIVIEIYCLGVVPLKKIEETDEDQITGNINLYDIHGSTLLSYSSLMLLSILLILIFTPLSIVEKTFSFTLIGSTIALIQIFNIFSLQLKILYNSIVRLVILESIFYVLYLKVLT